MKKYPWTSITCFIVAVYAFSLMGCPKNGPGPIVTCTPPDGWTAAIYLELNPDVLAAGTDATKHWCEFGLAENRPWRKTTDPVVIGEIKNFVRLSESDNPISAYMGLDWPLIGTYGYQGGDHSSEVYRYPHDKVMSFQAESVINILDDICLLENGGPQDRGQIYTGGKLVYTHPRWTLMLEIHKHIDGFSYATGMNYENRSDPAGWVRSSDKINWSVWHENVSEYRFFAMDSDLQGNLWTASTSSGVDWGANDCNPSVFRNKELVWRDTSRPNDGFWGIKCAFNDVFLGGTGRARIVRLSDKKTVLDLPGFNAVHRFFWDKKTNTLMALASRDSGAHSSGARVYGTKDGHTWTQIGPDFDCPFLFQGQQLADGTIYVVGGRWSQNNVTGYGRVYKGVR